LGAERDKMIGWQVLALAIAEYAVVESPEPDVKVKVIVDVIEAGMTDQEHLSLAEAGAAKYGMAVGEGLSGMAAAKAAGPLDGGDTMSTPTSPLRTESRAAPPMADPLMGTPSKMPDMAAPPMSSGGPAPTQHTNSMECSETNIDLMHKMNTEKGREAKAAHEKHGMYWACRRDPDGSHERFINFMPATQPVGGDRTIKIENVAGQQLSDPNKYQVNLITNDASINDRAKPSITLSAPPEHKLTGLKLQGFQARMGTAAECQQPEMDSRQGPYQAVEGDGCVMGEIIFKRTA